MTERKFLSLNECTTQVDILSKDFEMFAHITSHDLRDPLRQAVINCEEMKGNPSSHSLDEIISPINEVIDKIAKLREYSYIANYSKEFESINCNEVLKEITGKLSDKIELENATISSMPLPVIKGAPDQIRTLFFNLLDNAIKFRSKNNPIVTIKAIDNKTEWEFQVTDNGIGLEEVYRDLVFSLFQRLTPEVKDGSLGAGLSFCKKIAENHGGKIWFKSDGENGSSFFFTIKK